MNIEKSINRISWRFKNKNVKINESKIIINQQDIDAVNFLIDWVNRQKKDELQHNLLFAKIYCYALCHELEFYKDIKFANKKLQEQLKLPIEQHYENVMESLNRNELNLFMKSLGLETDLGKRIFSTIEEKELEKSIIKNNENQIKEYVLGKWDFKAICKALNNQITECINMYKKIP